MQSGIDEDRGPGGHVDRACEFSVAHDRTTAVLAAEARGDELSPGPGPIDFKAAAGAESGDGARRPSARERGEEFDFAG